MFIDYKVKTKLVNTLLQEDSFENLPSRGFFQKLFKKEEFAPIYFHSGAITKENKSKILNAKKVFVNSKMQKQTLLDNCSIDDSIVHVLYPSISLSYEKPKEVKKRILQKLNLEQNKKIVFFTAKNFNNSGIKEFISIIEEITFPNFIAIIAGDKQQITTLKFQLSKINVNRNILFLEDYKNIDELFLASDIFILPTHSKNFPINILKAMFCKCAVFVPKENAASELIDFFSTMESPDDRSMQFKVNALLENDKDLKLIKKQNRAIAKEYTLEKQLEKFRDLSSNLF